MEIKKERRAPCIPGRTHEDAKRKNCVRTFRYIKKSSRRPGSMLATAARANPTDRGETKKEDSKYCAHSNSSANTYSL